MPAIEMLERTNGEEAITIPQRGRTHLLEVKSKEMLHVFLSQGIVIKDPLGRMGIGSSRQGNHGFV